MDLENIIREYIEKTVHMSLGTSKENRPWVCEVHFVYDEQLNLYFRSLKSRRHSQEIADNSHVAGNIVKQHQLSEDAHGIYFEGQASLIEDEADRKKAFVYFESRLGATKEILAEANSKSGHQFYTIKVDTWYAFGKFGLENSQKYSLDWRKHG